MNNSVLAIRSTENIFSRLLELPILSQNQYVTRYKIPESFFLSAEEKKYLELKKIDWAIVPDMAFNELGLIVSDMDSTLITIECIDEIAARMGIKERVALITERSMRGELDFSQSLKERVKLLQGLTELELQTVYDEVLELSPGAIFLIQECQKYQIKFMLVSGGFTFFTDQLKTRLGLDYTFANTLECKAGKLTGKVIEPIIDSETKAQKLKQYRQELALQKHQVLAVGDGANDIPMLQEAGIAVAYHAKPKTKQYATFCINHSGLDFIRYCFS